MGSNSLAVVTGAASGVGAATTARLRSRGIDVIGVDISLINDIPTSETDGNLTWVIGDISQDETWDSVIDKSRELGVAPSILVLAAAQLSVGNIEVTSDEDWDRVFSVNVFGAIKGMKSCLPGMVEAGKGSIVTVASIDAFMVEQNFIAYCASKGALLQITRCVALDYARHGIKANCVCPGVIDTPFFRKHLARSENPEEVLSYRKDRNPLGRLLSADEVAEVVEFAALSNAAAITGSSLVVDGGLSLGFEFHS